MEILKNLTFASAIIGYLILIVGIIFRNEKSNFIAWFLWTILDIIVLAGLVSSEKEASLVWVFTLGTGFVALLLLLKKNFEWGTTEKWISILTAICIVIFFTADKTIGITAGSIAVLLSGIPNLMQMKNKGVSVATVWVCRCMFIASICSLLSIVVPHIGHYDQFGIIDLSWTETAFPSICTIYWLLALAVASESIQKIPIT